MGTGQARTKLVFELPIGMSYSVAGWSSPYMQGVRIEFSSLCSSTTYYCALFRCSRLLHVCFVRRLFSDFGSLLLCANEIRIYSITCAHVVMLQ